MTNLYYVKKGSLFRINKRKFSLEKDIQTLFEKNLQELMGLTFVSGEYVVQDRRFDALAFNEDARSFVIIEYKRDRNSSLADQGGLYLSLLEENKGDAICEYNEKQHKQLKRRDVDWSQTRIAFVSTSFTKTQIDYANRKVGIELWQVQKFDNDIISVEKIEGTRGKERTSVRRNDKPLIKGIKEYTEEDQKQKSSPETWELYEKFRDAILGLDDGISIVPQKYYISFRTNYNISCIILRKSKIIISINFIGRKKLDDPRHLARDVSQIGHHGTGEYELHVSDDKNLEYIMSLIKQTLVD